MDPDPFGYGDLADPDPSVGMYGMGSRPGGWSFGSPNAWSPFTGQPGGYGAGSAANPIDPSAGPPTAGLFGNLSDILSQGADPSWGLLSAPAGGVAGSSPAVPDYGGLFSWTPGDGDPLAPTAVGAAGLNTASMSAPIAYGDPDQDAVQAPSSAAANDLDSAPDDVTTPQAVGRELPTDAPLLPAPAIPAWTTTNGHRAHHQTFQPGGQRLAFPAGSPGGAAPSGGVNGMQASAPRPAAHQPPFQGPIARPPTTVGIDDQPPSSLLDAAASTIKRWVEPPVRFIGSVVANPDTYRGLGEFATGLGLGGLGAVGDSAAGVGEVGSGALATPIAVPVAIESLAAIGAGAGLTLEAGNTLGAVLSKAAGDTGSYTNTHESQKTYNGKGPRSQSQRSGRRIKNATGDKHTATHWTASSSEREAFKDEARRLAEDGGPNPSKNYNKINSPGKKYLKQDGEK